MKKIIKTLPLIFVYIAIVYFSIKKPSGEPSLFKNIDKVEHFIAYGSLGFAIYLSTINKKIIYILISISLVLGLSLEFIQGQLPYRDMSIADGITNVLGLFAGVVAFHLLKRILVSRSHNE